MRATSGEERLLSVWVQPTRSGSSGRHASGPCRSPPRRRSTPRNPRPRRAKPAGYDYYGLSVGDDDGYHADIHPRSGTHGCYQIAPYTFDARHEGSVTGRSDDNQPWNQFQEQDLEAHASVGRGELTYDGVSPSVSFSAVVTHLGRNPKIAVTKEP